MLQAGQDGETSDVVHYQQHFRLTNNAWQKFLFHLLKRY